MIAFQVKELKNFMHKLLSTDCFDSFLLEEATVTAATTFQIDGHLNRDFYSREEWEDAALRPYDFASWKDMRGLCFDLIKGKRTPVNFRFVLHLTPEHTAALLQKNDLSPASEQVKAFVLNIKYDGSTLNLITATALHTFLPDKTPDRIWDAAMRSFLAKKEISVQEI